MSLAKLGKQTFWENAFLVGVFIVNFEQVHVSLKEKDVVKLSFSYFK